MSKGIPLHGRDHRPGGADPTTFGWVDPEVSSAMSYANTIQFGSGLVVTDQGDGVIRVDAPSGLLPRTVGEIGFAINSSLGTTSSLTISYQSTATSDGILVAAAAPSLPAAASALGYPTSCTDSKGNTYSKLVARDFQASPAVANEGAYVQYFWCANAAPLTQNSDTITVTWDNSVYDRSVQAWLVRRDGAAANTPRLLAATASNDAAVYASSQVTLTSPSWTPARNNSLAVAHIYAIKAGGVGGFGGIGGYSGFFQAQYRSVTGSKQTYLVNQNTAGADVYLVVGSGIAQYELDLGTLTATMQASFNGVAQNYSSGTNAWKGIFLFGID